MKQLITLFFAGFLWSSSNAQFTPLYGPNGSGFCSSVYAGDNFLLAGVNNDLYRSSDDGQTWTQITNGLPDNVTPDVITGLEDVVIIGTNSGDRCYRSTDDGLSWTPITEGLPDIFGTPAAVPDHACTYNG